MISGDINANADDIETLSDMLLTGGWTDVGAHGQRWGARKCEPTCWATNASLQGTRRDYIFVNAPLLPYVVRFGVCPLDELPTHATLQVLLQKPAEDYVSMKSVKPASLNKHFDAKLEEMQEAPHTADGEEDRPKTPKEKNACREQLLYKLHTNIDRLICHNEVHMDYAISTWDTKGAWRRIAK